MDNSIRKVLTVVLMLATCSIWGCSRPIHPDSMLIREVEATPHEVVIQCDPPLESYYVVDKMRVARKGGIVSVTFFKRNLYFHGKPILHDPVRIPIDTGDRSVVFTDGTANREIWNVDKGVRDFESGRYYHPPWQPAAKAD